MSSHFFPVVGVVLSNALYFSSVPDIQRAVQRGHIGSLNVLPQATMVISTISWVSYALSVPNGFIAASNLPGVLVAVWYIVTALPLVPRDNYRQRVGVQAVTLLGTACILTLWTALIFGGYSAAERSFALGLWGSLVCVVMFAAPLSTMLEVVQTQNAVSIMLTLTLAATLLATPLNT